MIFRRVFAAAFAGVSFLAFSADGKLPDGWVLLNNQFSPADIPAITDEDMSAFVDVGKANNRLPKLAARAGGEVASSAMLKPSLPVPDNSRIRELAKGLDFDIQKCYDFVRNHIAYTPYRGFMKGAERTLIDREGNDADQALLLCELMHACGRDDARVAHMPMRLPVSAGGTNSYNVCSLLGVRPSGDIEKDNYAVFGILSNVGLGESLRYGGDYLWMDRFLVRTDGECPQQYWDPSVKPATCTEYRDYASLMSFNARSFLNSVGGVVDGEAVRNISTQSVALVLGNYAGRLRKALSTDNASAAEMFPQKTILPWDDDALVHGELGFRGEDFVSGDEQFRDSFRTRVTLSFGGEEVRTFYLDEVGVRNLWISFEESGGWLHGVLHLDDVVVASESGTTKDENLQMTIAIDYANKEQSRTYKLERGKNNVYAMCVCFGADSPGGARKIASERLSAMKSRGLDDGDQALLARSMQVIGQQWASQCALVESFHSRIFGWSEKPLFSVGVAGHKSASYVDMRNCLSYVSVLDDPDDGYSTFYSSLFMSALEHSVLEQLNGPANPAVSTVKILSIANAESNAVHYIDCCNYKSEIGMLLGYGSLTNSFIDTAQGGGWVLVPEIAYARLNNWQGYGYALKYGLLTRMAIGAYLGGYSSQNAVPSAAAYIDGTLTVTYDDASLLQIVQADPVAMPSGAFLDSRTDLAINCAWPLAFTRSYDSRARNVDGELGRGWTHNFNMRLTETSDPDAVLGGGSVDAALPTVVAMTVVDGLLKHAVSQKRGEKARCLLAAALVVQWWSETLAGTSVSISMGPRSIRFQKRTDGSYAPSPGVTATLGKSGNTYTLRERNGDTYRFNAITGRLSSIMSQPGNTTTVRISSSGANSNLVSMVTNAFAATLKFTYKDRRIVKVTDSALRSVSYAYDNDGCLTNFTDAAGNSWRYEYDPDTHAMTAQYAPDDNLLVGNCYNSFCQVTNQVTSATRFWSEETSWKFGYIDSFGAWDEDPRAECSDSPDEYRLTQYYDDNGRPIERHDRGGLITWYQYDGHGHVVSETNNAGRLIRRGFDGRDNMVWTETWDGTKNLRTEYEYDSNNRLIATVNPLGETTRFTYNGCNLLEKTFYPDGSWSMNAWKESLKWQMESSYRYSPRNVLIARTFYSYTRPSYLPSEVRECDGKSSLLRSSRYNYNNAGQVTSCEVGGVTSQRRYNAAGQLIAYRCGNDKPTTYVYDNVGRISAEIDPLGNETSYIWTPSGKVAWKVLPNGLFAEYVYDEADNLCDYVDDNWWEFCQRDAAGRVTAKWSSAGEERFAYDLAGNLTNRIDLVGNSEQLKYDALGRCVASTDGLGNEVLTEYDAIGRVTAVTDPLGAIARTSYDAMGRKTAFTRPSGMEERFGYDVAGNMSVYTNSEGHVFTLAYDAGGHILSAVDASGRVLAKNTYRHDNIVKSIDGKSTTVTYTYNMAGRLTRWSFGGSLGSGNCSYDVAGNQKKATWSEPVRGVLKTGNKLEFAYDGMRAVTNATMNFLLRKYSVGYERDTGGRVTATDCGGGHRVVREYDSCGRLSSVSDWSGHTWMFECDALGRIVRTVSPSGAIGTRRYDAAGRLSAWAEDGFAGREIERDAAGRRIADRVSFGSLPRPSADRFASLEYDAADRVVSARIENGAPSGEGANVTFEYDGNGAMVSASATADGESTSANVFTAWYGRRGLVTALEGNSYAYDAFDNRIYENGTVWVPDYSDPLKRPLMECDESGRALRYYVWGPGRLLGVVDATSGELYDVRCDDFGSVIGITCGGRKIYSANYGPHGEDWGHEGNNPFPFGWLGGYGVKTVGSNSRLLSPLYVTRHRIYSAGLHRFLSVDPLMLDGGLNVYAYANGNPLAYIDPLGLCAAGEFWDDALTRICGGLQMVGGLAEGMVGVAGTFASSYCGNIPGAALGAAVWAHGADQMSAGAYRMWYGQEIDTQTSQALQSVGIPRDWANGIDAGLSVAGPMGVNGVIRTAGTMVSETADAATAIEKNVAVCRWGREGLQPGDYVIKGNMNRWNYFRSCKWQPGLGNKFAPYSSGKEYSVPESMLKAPSKAESASSIFDSAIMDPIKGGLFGQRSYWGPAK